MILMACEAIWRNPFVTCKMIVMPSELKKLLQPGFLFALFCLVGLYFLTRLINLTEIPVFVDEAIYIRWAQVMRAEPTLRFLPLSDGKQPLFMWLVIPSFKLFADPLFAGRFISILAGFGTLVGVFLLTWYLTKNRFTSLLASLLYIVIPYTLFFDRMALVDSLLSMFAIWSIFIGILFIQTPRLDLAMILGFILGGGLLTKSPAILFIALQPILLLSLESSPAKGKKHPVQMGFILKILAGWLIAGVIAFAMYNILRLGPNFNQIGARNLDYVFSFREVLSHPLNPFMTNFREKLITWYPILLTWPILLLIIFSLTIKKHRQFILPLFLWAILPILFQASIAKVFTSRYLLYTVPPLLITAAIALAKLKQSLPLYKGVLLIIILLSFATIRSFTLLTNPTKATLPWETRNGYFEEWTAGYGQKEISQYLIERAQNHSVVVGTEGYFGTLPDGLQIYTQNVPHLTVIGVGQPIFQIPDSLWNSLLEHEVYLVVNQSRLNLTPIEFTHLETIAEYPKPTRTDGTHETLLFFRLYKEVVR